MVNDNDIDYGSFNRKLKESPAPVYRQPTGLGANGQRLKELHENVKSHQRMHADLHNVFLLDWNLRHMKSLTGKK